MKLSYRGSLYNADAAAIASTTAAITAKYRGASYFVRSTANTIDVPPGMTLKFRGSVYSKDSIN